MGSRVFLCCSLHGLAVCKAINLGNLLQNIAYWNLCENIVAVSCTGHLFAKVLESMAVWLLSTCEHSGQNSWQFSPSDNCSLFSSFYNRKKKNSQYPRGKWINYLLSPGHVLTESCSDFYCHTRLLHKKGLMETHHSTLLGKRGETQSKDYVLVSPVFLSLWWSCLLFLWTESPSFKVGLARGALILIPSPEKILSMLSATVMTREAPPAKDWTCISGNTIYR